MKAGNIAILRHDAHDWKKGQPVQLEKLTTVCLCRGTAMRDVKAWEVVDYDGKRETLRQTLLEAA
jgi:hypothetical protein